DPMFYDRKWEDVPREWVGRMKTAIRTICPNFNTYRMVEDYSVRFYIPCCRRRKVLFADNRKPVYELADWKSRVAQHWHEVRVDQFTVSGSVDGLTYDDSFEVLAEVTLGSLKPSDARVEIFFGNLDASDQIPEGDHVTMDCIEDIGSGRWRYRGEVPCKQTGQLGFTIRILPDHPDLFNKHELGLICWA
ncbi:MAG TPA: alpha-glucan phosphorylase, partial [Candidatus Hydrogenedentes bacterium]|nr:alpha-glucan phosphorylase [Candidatus Hydrogenedentota bacterium]